jgi:hypothetical protein
MLRSAGPTALHRITAAAGRVPSRPGARRSLSRSSSRRPTRSGARSATAARLACAASREARMGFRRSSGSTVRVRYATARRRSSAWIDRLAHELTLDDQYREWPRSHEPPLFEAIRTRLMQLAPSGRRSPRLPRAAPARDEIAARAGVPDRCTRALAPLADEPGGDPAKGLATRVIRADFLAGRLPLPRPRYRLVVLSGVCPHLRDVEMRHGLFRGSA